MPSLIRGMVHPPGSGILGVGSSSNGRWQFTSVRRQSRMEIHKDHKKSGEAPCAFTLLDVLGEVYWEIGFHANPESRDRRGAELLESVREVEEGWANLVE